MRREISKPSKNLEKRSYQKKHTKLSKPAQLSQYCQKLFQPYGQNFAKLIEPFKPTSSSYCQRDIKNNLTQRTNSNHTINMAQQQKDLCPCFHQPVQPTRNHHTHKHVRFITQARTSSITNLKRSKPEPTSKATNKASVLPSLAIQSIQLKA